MILNCDICGRPDHNSEVHPESRCWREQGTQSGRLDCFERGYVRLKAEVAAAEERGRRRGLEERDALLRECREWFAAEAADEGGETCYAWVMRDRIDAALGKE